MTRSHLAYPEFRVRRLRGVAHLYQCHSQFSQAVLFDDPGSAQVKVTTRAITTDQTEYCHGLLLIDGMPHLTSADSISKSGRTQKCTA